MFFGDDASRASVRIVVCDPLTERGPASIVDDVVDRRGDEPWLVLGDAVTAPLVDDQPALPA